MDPTIGSSCAVNRRRPSPKRWLWWLLLPGCLASWTRYIEEYDSIRVARCDAHCGNNYPEMCMENCLASNYTKPGQCPDKGSMSPFEAVCLVACDHDSRCPDLAKCCRHECGVTCMHPLGLDNRSDLPEIPENLQIRQQKNNLVLLTWHDTKDQRVNESSSDGNVRYLVEERHLLGPRYLESRLSSWTVRHVSSKSHATLRERLKTGHWYQFRVAAINQNGSRGYSQPSRPFKTRVVQKQFAAGRAEESEGAAEFDAVRREAGRREITDHPQMGETSLRRAHNVLQSVLEPSGARPDQRFHPRLPQNGPEGQDLLPAEELGAEVPVLPPGAGGRVVRGPSSDVAESLEGLQQHRLHGIRCDRYRAGLHVRRMMCHCGEVKVRLVWPTNHDVKAYNVSWSEESCSKEKHAASRKKILWKVVQTSHLEIWHLRNECTYNVNVRNIFEDEVIDEHGASIEFLATGCRKEHDQKEKKLSYDKMAQCKSKSFRNKRYFNS